MGPTRGSNLRLPNGTARRIRHELAVLGCGAVLGAALVLSPGAAINGSSPTSIASAPFPGGIILGLEFPKAQAESRRQRRIRREREAREARQREADRKLLSNRIDSLPSYCAFDSFASFTSPTDIHVCGAFYFRPYEEDGATGFEGYPIGSDPKEIDRAKARRDKARKKRWAEAKEKLKTERKTALSTDCSYDSFASFNANSNVYTCGGVQFMQLEENGVTVFDRHGPGSVSAQTKRELARRAKALSKDRAEEEKKSRGARRATLPQGCTYDSYASFFTSSNVYSCAGARYRQHMEGGTTTFEEIDL